jgi:hypothetical protein
MGTRRGPYVQDFTVGTQVRIKPLQVLVSFQRLWKLHNPLHDDQLAFAGRTAEVASAGFYHGGDELYVLVGVPGIWHEQCLESLDDSLSTGSKSQVPKPRALTDEERSLIRWMLGHATCEVAPFIDQLANASVSSGCPCGCASINLAINGHPTGLLK